MRKSDGGYTYFVPDVAYHVTKFERGFSRAINVQGSDHHGTIARVRAGLQAVGIGVPAGYPDYLLHKMVTVMRGGEEVKISKRAGSYVTLRELIDEAGRDAVRFFLVSRKADSEFIFDIDLARSQSEENPVYYVQYGHARIAAIIRKAEASGITIKPVEDVALGLLVHEAEAELLRALADVPGALSRAAELRAPHRIAHVAQDLAGRFHRFYTECRVVGEDAELTQARLWLCRATQQVLANLLQVLGVSAPARMDRDDA